MKKIELFYIGGSFYSKSGTSMSSIYTVEGRQRYDWGKVSIALEAGGVVEIRQATQDEMLWVYKKLEEILDGKD